MEPTDITIVVLREIRDELRGLKEGQTEVRDEIRQTNERLDRHEQVLIQLVHGQERHEKLLERHEKILDRHEKSLSLLVTEVRELGSRIDNIVTGPMGEKVRELDRRVTTLESRAGIGQP
jgi:chromosome segregation ATPase